MDDPRNTNNPLNNPTPATPFGAPPPPPPPPQPTPSWPPLPPTPPTPAEPPMPEPTPPAAEPVPAPTQSEPAWTPPVQPTPQPEPTLPQSEPTPMPAPEPTPTFTPPQTDQPQPTSEPSAQPSWTASSETPPGSAESVPTDLSHLISNNPGQEPSAQPSAETLVVPPVNNSQGEPPYQSTTHKGIPRWLIGLGVGLLVLVGGTSAYFILGIGQPKTTTSVPAQVAPQTTEVNPPPPLPIPTAQPATGSANFGELEGSGVETPNATSAADLIRQRQEQGM